MMNLMPWKNKHKNRKDVQNSIHPLQRMQDEIDQLYNELRSGFSRNMLNPESDYMTKAGLLPEVDVEEGKNEYKLTVEMPGVDEKDIDVSVAENTLTIKGEKKEEHKEEDKNYYQSEISYGAYQRSFELPSNVDKDNIKADFKNGVLTLHVPKSKVEENKTKKISINK